MDIIENVKEGINSIKANKLRTILTAAIIAIGITSLVGILTAIEGIQSSINDSFSNLGANTFDIESKRANRGSRDGKTAKVFPPLTYDNLLRFKEKFTAGQVSINAAVTWTAEVTYASQKSNPNIRVQGGDYDYLVVDGYDISEGRSFSQAEVTNGAMVVIIGSEVKKSLFANDENPIGKEIKFLGGKFKVIGMLGTQGGSGGDDSIDRMCLVPTLTARKLAAGRRLNYEVTVAVNDPEKMDAATGLATGLMRAIRRDPVKSESSFEVKVNQSLAERLGEITGYLRIGGFTIGFITLLGASIGLMNIMLVSVTERTREIGVRKALGATPLKIRQQFLIEALVICQMGGLGGIVLGIAIGNLTSGLISDGGFVIPWVWIIFGVVVGMIVGLISGYLPAYKASKLDPIDSLRFE
ncbi:ABC transporter permease [Marinoscillum furvescens]|uniref:Putative ABC transport system permease protein n=1 Tax=Marinoscillum furvescens DSM 4134 TaxID=1122208 RepID=A0A3D9KZM7_MARFU|nr:ABC transporter permease [Marinoscillum furvescens]RED93864.1 putative ABC transport system permease protein [Marinoscillum furvescens DSM 4134]